MPRCPECGQEMTDVNEGYFRLRFGPPEWECQNTECPECPKHESASDLSARRNENENRKAPVAVCLGVFRDVGCK